MGLVPPSQDVIEPAEMAERMGRTVGGATIRTFDGRPKRDPVTGILNPVSCRFTTGRVATTYWWDGWTETWIRDHLVAAAIEAIGGRP